jgi:hypothetical protein
MLVGALRNNPEGSIRARTVEIGILQKSFRNFDLTENGPSGWPEGGEILSELRIDQPRRPRKFLRIRRLVLDEGGNLDPKFFKQSIIGNAGSRYQV